MTLETNLNTSPYFDDYDIEKNFHRILFKPSVAVQARELTQLQTILQNQIERFGNNVLKEGTIVTGGNFVEVNPFPYVKINDNNVDGNAVVMANYEGKYAVGTVTGLRALIETFQTGFESQTPNLNTLYVKYLGTNDAGNKVFNTSENIEIQEEDGTVIDTVTVAGTSDLTPIGNGYGVRCGDGIIFQKGHFVRFENEITIVSKYDTLPNNVLIGFETAESLVNSNQDSSLLDNAQGFANENAPGADRLKLTPTLVTRTKTEAEDDNEFFAIQEYRNGNVIRRRLTTVYNVIQTLIEKRSVEENGNFVVNRFPLNIEENTANTELNNFVIGRGLAYVEGRRIETVGSDVIPFEKAIDTATIEDQTIVANYGNYVLGSGLVGTFNINTYEQVNLVDGLSATIGTANIRSLTQTATNTFNAYIFNVQMNSGQSFEDVRTIENATGASLTVTLNSANNATLSDFSFKRAVYPIGKGAVKNLDLAQTQYRYRSANTTTTMTTSGTVTLNLPAGDTLPYTVSSTLNDIQKLDLTLISSETQAPYTDGDVINILGANSTVTVTSDSQLTIQMDDANSFPVSTMDVTLYHNADRDVSTVNSKTLQTIYIKIDTDTHPANTTGVYTLGVPDVFEIEGIYIGGTYSESNTNYVNGFTLFTQAKDTHYGLSTIAPAGSNPIVASDKILIKAKVFRNTSGVTTFFSVDSYPVDDVTEPLPVNKIRTEQIPIYVTDTGQRINLRDAIDLRPYAANTASYALTAGTATENPANTLGFGSSNLFFIGPNEAVQTNFDYYLGRIDRLVLDYTGYFYIIKGDPADEPNEPPIPEKAISPCTINVGPFPSIPVSTAARADRNEYSVYLTRIDNDNYYPEDIRKIEKRIKNLEDYTSLSLLETKATDLVIQDANGLDRFKNGILVDSFKDFSVANNNDDQFKASIDPNQQNLLPRFRSFPLDLKIVSTSTVTAYDKNAVLTFAQEEVIKQQFASSQKSCTTDFWKFRGEMFLSPEADTGVDVVRAPDINFNQSENNNAFNFNARMNEQLPQVRPSVPFTLQNGVITGGRVENTTTLNQTFENNIINQGPAPGNIRANGSFVSDINFDSFMRSRDVEIIVTGMRPNTQVYFFFDKVDVNAAVAPAVVSAGSLRRGGQFGSAVKSDANGNVIAFFRIPANTFYVGERVLEVYDVNLYDSRDSATTSASQSYNAFNLGVAVAGIQTPAPRPPVINNIINVTNNVTNVTNVTNRTTNVNAGRVWNRDVFGQNNDPLAQTFIIDQNSSQESVAIIPSIDLFFARKSETNGITVEIREVVNGYPTPIGVPYSKKHLLPADITANNTSATTPTNVLFDNPVILKTGQEYCVVCKPDANDPDYLVWISRTGEVDVDTGFAIRQDTNAGTLFTSTNDKAWTAYQDENLKFTLYKADFTSQSGSITLTNPSNEFFKVSGGNNVAFQEGEYVFKDNANTYLTGTLSVVSGNTTVVGTGTTFTSDYEEGEHIIINYPANPQVMEIGSIANNTTMTLSDIPREDATDVQHFTSVVGSVSYYYDRDPNTLVLERSTAKPGFVFAASDVIVGEDSGAEASISELYNLKTSYIQANILQSNFSTTRTSITGTFSGPVSQYTRRIKPNDNNYLINNETVIKSRSNEITDDAGANSFELQIDLTAQTSDASPVVDHEGSTVFAYEYFINNDSTNEKTNFGSAESKYVSNKVELADGLDGEDMRVFLTAYRPPSTDVEVWVKMMASTDPNNFNDCTCVVWTQLERQSSNDTTSSSANREDFREYEYILGSDDPGAGNGAYLINGETFRYVDNDGAVYNNFKFFAVKIVLKSTSHKIVPRVKDMRAIALS